MEEACLARDKMKDDGPLQPKHIREAVRVLKNKGRMPNFKYKKVFPFTWLQATPRAFIKWIAAETLWTCCSHFFLNVHFYKAEMCVCARVGGCTRESTLQDLSSMWTAYLVSFVIGNVDDWSTEYGYYNLTCNCIIHIYTSDNPKDGVIEWNGSSGRLEGFQSQNIFNTKVCTSFVEIKNQVSRNLRNRPWSAYTECVLLHKTIVRIMRVSSYQGSFQGNWVKLEYPHPTESIAIVTTGMWSCKT